MEFSISGNLGPGEKSVNQEPIVTFADMITLIRMLAGVRLMSEQSETLRRTKQNVCELLPITSRAV